MRGSMGIAAIAPFWVAPLRFAYWCRHAILFIGLMVMTSQGALAGQIEDCLEECREDFRRCFNNCPSECARDCEQTYQDAKSDCMTEHEGSEFFEGACEIAGRNAQQQCEEGVRECIRCCESTCAGAFDCEKDCDVPPPPSH